MSATAMLERAEAGCDERGCPPTLDRVVAATWSKLTAHDPADCPVCSAPMAPVYGEGLRPVGGRCTECGTELR